MNIPHPNWNGVKIRVTAFVAGLLCGALLVLTSPWKLAFTAKADQMALNAGEGDTIIKIDADENQKAAVTISYLQELTQDASDLITTRYYYKDANTYSNTKQLGDFNLPFTTAEYVYTYEGTVSLGIDISKIGFSVDNTNEEIEVRLPDIRIIANEIDADSFEYYASKTTVFNMTEMADITDLIAALKESKAEKVMADKELLADAEQRAETVVEDLIAKSDLAAGYKITFN